VIGNRITGNRRGLYLQNSRATVTGNDLSGNSEHGIFLEDGEGVVHRNRIAGNGRAGVRWVNAGGSLLHNTLVDNGEYALLNDGRSAIDACGNWWGDADPVLVAAVIRDGLDRKGLGLVKFDCALLQPFPWVPPVTPSAP
jgi:parallel beta-helix repeat protein